MSRNPEQPSHKPLDEAKDGFRMPPQDMPAEGQMASMNGWYLHRLITNALQDSERIREGMERTDEEQMPDETPEAIGH